MYECGECCTGDPDFHALWCRGHLNWHAAWERTLHPLTNTATPDYHTRMSAFRAGWLAAMRARYETTPTPAGRPAGA